MKDALNPKQCGTVYYDASCGFCSRWIPFWAPTLARRGFAIGSLQSALAEQRLQATPDDWLSDLRLVLDDGEQHRGAGVYRYIFRRIWWAYPLYLLSITPGTRRLFEWGYRQFATHRFRISAACRLK